MMITLGLIIRICLIINVLLFLVIFNMYFLDDISTNDFNTTRGISNKKENESNKSLLSKLVSGLLVTNY